MTLPSSPPIKSLMRGFASLVLTLATACSTAHDVTPAHPSTSREQRLTQQTRALLSRAGVRVDASDVAQLDANPELLASLTPAERSLVLSDLYSAESRGSTPDVSLTHLLRAAHYAGGGLNEAQCHAPNDAVCAALKTNYTNSLTTVMRDLNERSWAERVSVGGTYDLHLNGDGSTLDISEWKLTFPERRIADDTDSSDPVGAVAVACKTEEGASAETLFTTCMPIVVTATFESAPSSPHTRVYLTASSVTSEIGLSSDTVAASWRTLSTIVQDSSSTGPTTVRAHLGCIGEAHRARPTTLIVLDNQYPIEPWAEISTAVSADESLRDQFNFCTYTDFQPDVTNQAINDLATAVTKHLAPTPGIFISRRPSKVVFVTQGPHSSDMIAALRESLKRSSRSALPEIETTGVFAVSPHLFRTPEDVPPPTGSQPLPVASISVAERDIRRLLAKIIEQQESSAGDGEEAPDFTLSPVM